MRRSLGLAVPLLVLWTSAMAQEPPRQVNSLEGLRREIAWAGAVCLLNASEGEVAGRTLTPDRLAEETGVPPETFRQWAALRVAENRIAVDVLLSKGEPYPEPPEPFLYLLRLVQNDCQEYVRLGYILERAIERGTLPDRLPEPEPSALRPSLDPEPFQSRRLTRLKTILSFAQEAIAAGYEAEYLRLVALTAGREVAVDDILRLQNTEQAEGFATALLLPTPGPVGDLTTAEGLVLLERFSQETRPMVRAYYVAMILHNIETLTESGFFEALTDPTHLAALNDILTAERYLCALIEGQEGLVCRAPPANSGE